MMNINKMIEGIKFEERFPLITEICNKLDEKNFEWITQKWKSKITFEIKPGLSFEQLQIVEGVITDMFEVIDEFLPSEVFTGFLKVYVKSFISSAFYVSDEEGVVTALEHIFEDLAEIEKSLERANSRCAV